MGEKTEGKTTGNTAGNTAGGKGEPIIRLAGLGKQFKTAGGVVTALEDINLEINHGEIFGIIGLSGAGKSTLVRCINYLEVPTSGAVVFEGVNLAGKNEKVIRKARQSMGMIFQQFISYPLIIADIRRMPFQKTGFTCNAMLLHNLFKNIMAAV